MKRKLKKWFENLKLSKKMIVMYLVFVGILFGFSMLALQVSFNVYDNKLYEKSLQELDFFTQQVNNSLQEIEDLSYAISMDTQIQEKLFELGELDYLSSQYYSEVQQLRYLLVSKIANCSAVKNLIFTDRKSITFIVGTACGEIENARYGNILTEFQEKRGGYALSAPTKNYPYLVSGRDILRKKNASLDYLGTILFTSDISGLIDEKAEKLASAHSTLYVYSENGMIYQDDDKNDFQTLDTTQNKGYEIIRIKGEKYFMSYIKSKETGWMYVNLFPYSEIFSQTTLIRYGMLVGFILLFVATIIVVLKVSHFITRPLEKLTVSMQIVETGDFQKAKKALAYEIRTDETGILSQEFRTMLEKIDTLIHENYEKQILLKDTKYKMLQAQINPHFLYNTLNAINWMIRAEENENAEEMIIELGYLLRASFAKEPYTIVREELDVVRSYMTIQKYRYQKRVEFVIEMKGNPEEYRIPRMILQPLIENAIYYGVEHAMKCCEIKVFVEEEDNYILLQISDTGQGMSEEELQQIRNGTIVPKGHGIGLKNIRERLNITYENSEFMIHSQIGVGTEIQIRIPKVRKKDV
jgi:Predicted signal transduction protein with a C-terminal ATPase domain